MLAQPSSNGAPAAEAVVRALLFTDLVDSTKLVAQIGDVRACEVATYHDRVARDLMVRFGGLEIDKSDGFLLLFEHPGNAAGYALAYHRALAELSVELGVQLRSRAGIHLGEVLLRHNPPEDIARGAKPLEVEGFAKPTAARVMSLARGRQTLLTETAFNQAREAGDSLEGADVRWLAHGTYRFQGIAEPLPVFEVGIRGVSALKVPSDTNKARREVAAGDEITLGWRPAPGDEIPRRRGWILRRKLGNGSFGEVWLAARKITGALRVFKFCYEAERLRSLQREVTLFRLLKDALGDREDIARIYDWQLDQAPFFLEAEYTEAGSMEQWVETQGGLGTVPIATRLELAAQVAEALAAAHSVGVLHKDIKPQNVLVRTDLEDGPRIRLNDFGIGLATDQRQLLARGITLLGLTETAPADSSSSAGTRLYMAPEVIEGKVHSVQSDVYSLGVMLYQLVVGDLNRALATGWRREVEDELLAADIATFVDGEPHRRPGSVLEVAQRVRTLDSRRAALIAERSAHAEAKVGRLNLQRAHRRRRVASVVAALATLVLAVVSVLAVQAINARRAAEEAQVVADEARGEAARRRGQAEDLIGYMLDDLQKKLESVGRVDILNDAAEKALAYFDSVPETDLTDDEVFRRSEALMQIGWVRLTQGKPEDAEETFVESLNLVQDLVQQDPGNDDWQNGLGRRHFWIGRILWDRGDLDGALARFRIQREIAQTLAAADPGNLDLRLAVAYAYNNVGFVQKERGDLEGALAAFNESLALAEGLVALNPDNKSRFFLASSHNAAGSTLLQLGKQDAALRNFEDERRLTEAVLTKDPGNTAWQLQLAVNHSFLGRSMTARGKHTEAFRHLQEYSRLAARLTTIDPAQTDWQRELATAHRQLSDHLRVQGELHRSVSEARQSKDIMARLVDLDPSKISWQRDLARSYVSLGEALERLGDDHASQRNARNAIDVLVPLAALNENDRQVKLRLAEGYLLLGKVLAKLAKTEEANAASHKAASLVEPLATNSADVDLLRLRARTLLGIGRQQSSDNEPQRNLMISNDTGDEDGKPR